MRILRFILLAASVIGAAYVFHALHAGSFLAVQRPVAWLFALGLVLNSVFLLFCGPMITGNSRISYLLRLWYNAKMRELRAGEPPRMD